MDAVLLFVLCLIKCTQRCPLLLKLMSEEERANWERIKIHFETLPEFKRDNGFYRRACVIVAGGEDPIEPLPIDISEDD